MTVAQSPTELLARWRPYLRPATPLLVIALAVAIGLSRGVGAALLVLAAGMLLAVIALFWGSVQSLNDDRELTLDEALALAAPSAEEEKKRAVLRALKDLEFERSVGKVSEEDYAKLSTRYRAEAKQLLRQLDSSETPARERAERLIQKRLERAGLASSAPEAESESSAAASESDAESNADDDSSDEDTSTSTSDDDDSDDDSDDSDDDSDDDDDSDKVGSRKCDACETFNDLDARFCKRCGEELA